VHRGELRPNPAADDEADEMRRLETTIHQGHRGQPLLRDVQKWLDFLGFSKATDQFLHPDMFRKRFYAKMLQWLYSPGGVRLCRRAISQNWTGLRNLRLVCKKAALSTILYKDYNVGQCGISSGRNHFQRKAIILVQLHMTR
jgi:hypothetical protein